MEEQHLMPFEGNAIRKIWHNDEWYFSVVDVIEVLTDSPLPRQYWNKVKKAIDKENQSYPFWLQLTKRTIPNFGKVEITCQDRKLHQY